MWSGISVPLYSSRSDQRRLKPFPSQSRKSFEPFLGEAGGDEVLVDRELPVEVEGVRLHLRRPVGPRETVLQLREETPRCHSFTSLVRFRSARRDAGEPGAPGSAREGAQFGRMGGIGSSNTSSKSPSSGSVRWRALGMTTRIVQVLSFSRAFSGSSESSRRSRSSLASRTK